MVSASRSRRHVVSASLGNFIKADGVELARPEAPATPGDELVVLTQPDDVVHATARVISKAQRLLSIVSHDFEPDLYDHDEVIDGLKRFVLAHSFAKARVLVRSQRHLTDFQNRCSLIARRLSSYIEIRVFDPEVKDPIPVYCIADDNALVYRLRCDRWDGIASYHNPPVARQYLQAFDLQWQQSALCYLQKAANL